MRRARSRPDTDGYNARYHIKYKESEHTYENIIKFIECLPVPSGALAGEGNLLKLLPWQKRLIKKVWARDGSYKNEILLCIARRNGKTVFLAALLTFLLFNQHKKSKALPGSLMVSAATNQPQAALTFDIMALWCNTVIELNDRSDVVHNTKSINILDNPGVTYRAISAEARSALGGNYSVIFCDEIGHWRNNKLQLALRSGMASTPPDRRIFLQASTCPVEANHFFYQEVEYFAQNKSNPRTYALVCMADPRSDKPNAVATYKKSNPSYGVLVHKESFEEEYESAKNIPAKLEGYLAYRLNMPTGLLATDKSKFVTIDAWQKCKGKSKLLDGEQIVVAWDAASTQDLTAILAMSITPPHRTWCKIFVPKKTADRREYPWAQWAQDGHCKLITSDYVSKQLLVDEYLKLQQDYDLVCSRSDMFGYPEIAKLAEEQGVDLSRHTAKAPRRADTHDGLQILSEMINNKVLVHNSNPVLTFCVTNMRITRSRSGDSMIIDRQLSTKRGQKIDAAISLMLCASMVAGSRPPTTELNFEGIVL